MRFTASDFAQVKPVYASIWHIKMYASIVIKYTTTKYNGISILNEIQLQLNENVYQFIFD